MDTIIINITYLYMYIHFPCPRHICILNFGESLCQCSCFVDNARMTYFLMAVKHFPCSKYVHSQNWEHEPIIIIHGFEQYPLINFTSPYHSISYVLLYHHFVKILKFINKSKFSGYVESIKEENDLQAKRMPVNAAINLD